MTTITTVNVDSCLRALRAAIAGCLPHGLAKQLWVEDARDIIDLIRQQQSRIAELESAQQAMDAALREAASVEVSA